MDASPNLPPEEEADQRGRYAPHREPPAYPQGQARATGNQNQQAGTSRGTRIEHRGRGLEP